MKLSPGQVSRFWREWGAIIRAHNWNKQEAEEYRHALLQRAGFTSLTKVDKTAGFDRVLAELGALRDNLQRAEEAADPTIGEARRLRHVIRTEIIPCLSLYLDPMPSAAGHGPSLPGRAAAEAYLQQVVIDLVRWEKTDRPTRPPTLDDLDARPIVSRSGPCHSLRESPSPLAQTLMTLNARLHAKRNEAGDTIHDMKKRAGLPCDCRRCLSAADPKPKVQLVMTNAAEESGNDPF